MAREIRTKPAVRSTTLAAVGPPPQDDEVPEPLDDPLRRSDVDEWGRSENLRELLRTLYDPLYKHWFRAEWEGLEHIPRSGGALLVANHAGAIPSDAPTIMHGIETELGRVQAHPDNAYRLLREQGQLVLTFPEGSKGPGKLYRERYQLRRFGRGGFVEIAMRAGVPIVPIAVVGAEESMPIVFKVPQLAKALRIPYFPVTANMLAFGPVLGQLVYFPAKFKLRVLDPIYFDVEPDQPRYSRSRIMDYSESIREQIQEALYDMLRHRRSIWFG